MTSKSAEESARLLGARMARMAVETMVRRIEEGDHLGALEARATAVSGLDVMTRQAVAGASAAGSSWKDVGDALGVSKQAAHQRWATSKEHMQDDLAAAVGQELDDLAAARRRRS